MRTTKSHDDLLDQVEEYIKDNLPSLQKKLDEKAYKMDCACELSYLSFDWHTAFFVVFIDEDERVKLCERVEVSHFDYLDFENEVLTRL
jgi:hypothetical protein